MTHSIKLWTGSFRNCGTEDPQRSSHPSLQAREGRPFSPLAACLSFKPSNEGDGAVLENGLENNNPIGNDGTEPMQLNDEKVTSASPFLSGRPFFGAWECDTPPGLDIPFPTQIDEDSVMTDAFNEPSGTGLGIVDITIPPAEGDAYRRPGTNC